MLDFQTRHYHGGTLIAAEALQRRCPLGGADEGREGAGDWYAVDVEDPNQWAEMRRSLEGRVPQRVDRVRSGRIRN